MSLLSSASTVNRVVDSDLIISYTRRLVTGSWTVATSLSTSTTYTRAYEYTRSAAYSYRYVGMTLAAAQSKASDLVSLYTRATLLSDWDETTGRFDTIDAGTLLMADISVQHTEGDAYDVVVNVREADSRMSLSGALSPSSLFPTENNRSYDQ